MQQPLEGAWNELLQYLRKKISPQSYDTWLSPTRQVGCTENSISIGVSNEFFKEWLIEHYKEQIQQAAQELGKGALEINFVIEGSVAQEVGGGRESEKKGFGFFARSLEKFAQPQEFVFNRRYSFEEFVVGESNRFAHAACFAVAENPAKAYNPLFIYGGVGLGKTHLMQAVGQYIIKKHSRLRVLYISSERFTNQLISAIQNRTTQNFRDKYRQQDVLLIDDIQFISGKESTQEEFFHTFNALHNAHKQIVISSDRPPKEIPSLEKRLVSRFEWGLVTDIQSPDLETRIAILRKKMEGKSASVPDDVLYFIADNIKSNIRELEGALIRIMAYSSLIGRKITLDVAKEVLKEIGDEKTLIINVEDVQRAVADYFGINVNDLRLKRRTKKIVFPRQIAMYISKELTRLPLIEIGGLFGGRDHTTVIYAYEKITNSIKNNSEIKRVVENIITKIKTKN